MSNCDLWRCQLKAPSASSFPVFRKFATMSFWFFIDKKKKQVGDSSVQELQHGKTNFNGQGIEKWKKNFWVARVRTLSPLTDLILARSKTDNGDIIKGITDTWQWNRNLQNIALKTLIPFYARKQHMRAMYNPARMQVIEAAAQKLLAQNNMPVCPQANTPGLELQMLKEDWNAGLCGSLTPIQHWAIATFAGIGQYTKEGTCIPWQKRRRPQVLRLLQP